MPKDSVRRIVGRGEKMNKRVNLMVASTVGTTLEWYDFFAFAMCAVLVFDKLFFSAADPFMATLLALGTFAAGFLARPLGGVVFGILGDRIGRKKVLVVSRSEERRVGKECRKLCAPNQRHSA